MPYIRRLNSISTTIVMGASVGEKFEICCGWPSSRTRKFSFFNPFRMSPFWSVTTASRCTSVELDEIVALRGFLLALLLGLRLLLLSRSGRRGQRRLLRAGRLLRAVLLPGAGGECLGRNSQDANQNPQQTNANPSIRVAWFSSPQLGCCHAPCWMVNCNSENAPRGASRQAQFGMIV